MFIFIKARKSTCNRSGTMKRRRFRTTTVVMAVVVLAALVVIGVVLGVTLTQRNKELQMVHIVSRKSRLLKALPQPININQLKIMRHGKRTPADTYPTDPHINDTLYPVGWGQLTNDGKVQLYEAGKFFRNRYQNFLGDHYRPDEYYTQSTDVDRTKASMQLVNAGLWPPNYIQSWGPLNWQAIPVYAEPLSQDMLLLVRKPCAAYHIQRDLVVASEEIQAKLNASQELFDALTEHTGRTAKDFDDVMDVFSTLKAEDGFNLTLPDWTKGYYPDKMLEPTIFSFVLNAWNDDMNRFKGGVLLKKVIDDWQAKVNGTISPQARKAFLYGGHDSTIVNFMRTLKVWDSQMPDYGITILLELSKDQSGIYGVEVFLRNSTSVPPYKVTIPGCDTFCPLDQLVDLTKNVIPQNWDLECKNDGSYDVPEVGVP